MANALAAMEATIGNRCGGVKVTQGSYVVFTGRLGYSHVAMVPVFANEGLFDER